MRARGGHRTGTDLASRTASLRELVTAGHDRLPPDVLGPVTSVLERVGERAALSAEHTVVALAGATGAGKSSLFNALVGAEVARTSRQRPTTSLALGVVAESEHLRTGSTALLDWLGVPQRHDLPVSDRHRDGLMLLDLPDHDSVVAEHRVRADHVTQRADLLIWVTNPQKYADGVLHSSYLAPLAGKPRGLVVVVLNQIDRLSPQDAAACLADLARLVKQDGLDAEVVATSATTGAGLEELREVISGAVQRRTAMAARLSSELTGAADLVLARLPERPDAARATERAHATLTAALEQAAGVPLVVEAVRGSAVRDAVAHTGWPPTRWVQRFRRDPLRSLGLRLPGVGSSGGSSATAGASGVAGASTDLVRSSLPEPSPALRSAVASAARAYVDSATSRLPATWGERVHTEVVGRAQRLPDDLDLAVTQTSVGAVAPARWWRAVGVWQWLLTGALAAGLVWLAVLAVMAYLQVPPLLTPVVTQGSLELPWPTVLAIGGAVLGILTAAFARWAANVGAARRARRARARLRRSIDGVAQEHLVTYVGAELAALESIRAAARRARA
ncbi:GTPase [Serinibacter arcticus]|uniref:Putative ABC iron siderophore transporter n=1 Tax=Serinibacter arcticus TaxID=1655435 RepID=A0A4Z1E292_9MICO|nr:GTPase [Serinibacter arcticus]TGO06026.1 putative ABC iron siderophore transporter [Serinibacter arcticus]